MQEANEVDVTADEETTARRKVGRRKGREGLQELHWSYFSLRG